MPLNWNSVNQSYLYFVDKKNHIATLCVYVYSSVFIGVVYVIPFLTVEELRDKNKYVHFIVNICVYVHSAYKLRHASSSHLLICVCIYYVTLWMLKCVGCVCYIRVGEKVGRRYCVIFIDQGRLFFEEEKISNMLISWNTNQNGSEI